MRDFLKEKPPKGSALGKGPKSSPTFPSIHVAGLLITAKQLELLNFEWMSVYFGSVGQQQGYVNIRYSHYCVLLYIYLTSISSTEWLKTTPSIHLGICHYSVGHFYANRPPKTKDANWGRCLGGPCSRRALRGQDLHWSIRWLGQGYRNEGRKVSAVRGRSMGLLWVYTVEWSKLVYFPGEKHDFFRKYMVFGIYVFFV